MTGQKASDEDLELVRAALRHVDKAREAGDIVLEGELTGQARARLTKLDGIIERLGRLGRWSEVIAATLTKAQIHPHPSEAAQLYLAAGRMYLAKSSSDAEAIKCFEAAVEQNPVNHEALDLLRKLYEERGDLKSLLRVRRRAAELMDDVDRLAEYVEIARLVTERLRMPELGVELWHDVLREDPESSEALWWLARLYERARDWQPLARVLEIQIENISDENELKRALQKLGMIYADKLSDDARAVIAFRRLLTLDPEDRRAQEQLKRRYISLKAWDDLEEFYAATEKWDELIRIIEREAEGKDASDGEKIALLFRAARLWETGKDQPQRAARAYEKILSIDENNLDAAVALSPIYEQAGDARKLVRTYEVRLGHAQERPERIDLLREAGLLYEEKLGAPREAFARFLEAFTADPTWEVLREDVERLAAATGSWEEAIEAYGRAVAAAVDQDVQVELRRRLLLLYASSPGGQSQQQTHQQEQLRDVEGAPALEVEAPAYNRAAEHIPPAGTLYWNTGFPHDRAANQTRVVLVGADYELRNAVEAEPQLHAFPPISVTPSELGISPEQESVPIQFVVHVTGPAHLIGSDAGARSHWHSERVACDAIMGCRPVFVTLRVTAPGAVVLHVTLRAKGRDALERQLALHAFETPASVADRATAPPYAGDEAMLIDGDLGNAPHVHMSLRMLPRAAEYIPFWFGADLFEEPHPVHANITQAGFARQAAIWRGRLIALSGRYKPASRGEGSYTDAAHDAVRDMAAIGRDIHQAFFGREGARSEDLGRVAKLIAGRGSRDQPERLSIRSELLPLPWSLVYDRDLHDDEPVDIRGFWGSRFIIDRVVTVHLSRIPEPRLAMRERTSPLIACVNCHIDNEQNVAASSHQLCFLESLAAPYTNVRILESRKDFSDYLGSESINEGLIYFFCHGHAAESISERLFYVDRLPADDAYLLLEQSTSENRITVRWMADERSRPLAPGYPLVFLNACSTVQADEAFQSEFVSHFVRFWRAAGVLGTEWKVPTVFADRFGRELLHSFLVEGRPIGEALHLLVNRNLSAGDPFGLIYALYGGANIVA